MAKKTLLLGSSILLLAVIALALYYSPKLIHNIEFTKGLICGILLVTFFYLILSLINYFKSSRNDSHSNHRILVLTFTTALCIALISVFGFMKDNRKIQERTAFQILLIQKEVLSLQKNQALSKTKESLFKKIQKELTSDSNKISEQSMQEISRISRSYVPYESMKGDSLSTLIKSPERGQLLLDILHFSLDSTSLEKIFKNTTFAYAEIIKAKLKGVNLSNIDLTGSHLREADLSFSNLQDSKLFGADLWASNLEGAQMSRAKMKRSNLSWSKLTDAVLNSVELDGSILNNANLNGAHFKDASIKYAQLQSARCKHADFTNANFFESDLTKADLSYSIARNANLRSSDWADASLKESDLTGAVLRGAFFQFTDLSQANLTDVFVKGEDWFEQLIEWKTIGASDIKENYKKINEPSFPSNYILKKS